MSNRGADRAAFGDGPVPSGLVQILSCLNRTAQFPPPVARYSTAPRGTIHAGEEEKPQ